MFRFRETNVDTRLFRQLQDLASVLTGFPDINFYYSYGSAIDLDQSSMKLTASANWGIGDVKTHEAGAKTDILLRAIGTLTASNIRDLQSCLQANNHSALPKFGNQLITLLENIRLEEFIKRERPGTTELFATRRVYLKRFFTQQLEANITRSLALDELFCLIYLLIESDTPDPVFTQANRQQTDQLETLKPLLFQLFEAKRSRDTVELANQIRDRVEPNYTDMAHTYFIFPVADLTGGTEETAFDKLTRTDPLANDSQEEDPSTEKSETFEQEFATWHSENENADRSQNFMQFDLEEGTRSSLMGEGARETEEGDQALASMQGSSGSSDQNDYANMEAMPKQQDQQQESSSGNVYGRENQNAVKIIKEARASTPSETEQYAAFAEDIAPIKRRLSRTIEKMLEYKRQAPRRQLTSGRLSKKLLPVVTDEFPRLFYKKNEESKELDAAFTLLVDCSASMLDKMEDTKKGIVLFHEVLKSLAIPHTIIGFWEEATSVKDNYQPNYFHVIHSFNDSLYQSDSARIMQLEAQEDNRDGFSIRAAAEELSARSEKNRFLLVFSDGEPAAADYTENGIIDTNLAVSETRKKDIDVIGIFLAEGEIGEQEDSLMQNIYGKERLMIPTVTDLPDHFAPLLKRLLLRTI
ncbi:nitric oxide reductase activation protein NorD [Barrientosiimonas marina]|uniref:VWA domain-containing protein n=1 Tax=Lentibacillus kimchii TaxID=1542911 RepID=A0ABW2V064_9BACI